MPNVTPSGNNQRSAQDFIQSALRLVGALRSGNNLSADELNDCLLVLNDMMDGYSAERGTIFTVGPITKDQNGATLSLKANQQAYTLGNLNGNEDFLLARPPRLERVSIMYSASQATPVELAMEIYDDVRWQQIANKSTPSLLPQVCYPTGNYPDNTLYFWPIPTQANPVVLYAWMALSSFPDLETKFSFPPGYAEMLRYNLAMRLAAEFPCDLQKLQVVAKLAADTKQRLLAMNVQPHQAVCDEALIAGSGNGNIYTGGASRLLRN